MKLTKKIALTLSLMFSAISFSQNTTCANMEPICTNSGINFNATSNGPVAEIGNAYGCLGSQPNPTWYYFEISTAGTIDMNLSAPSDIDFIIWGPFSSLTAASNECGNLGDGGLGQNIVDCSYSSTSNETPQIVNAQVGEVYVMLVTNYANQNQPVTLTQTANSTGQTDCSIVQPDPCVSDPGTFFGSKTTASGTNSINISNEIYLCEGESFAINSNQDYILPNDTVAAPAGDGIYTAQLMWLVYNAPPIGNDPNSDPGFLGNSLIVPSDNLVGTNSSSNSLFQSLGDTCGTFYFVPVAGDDGVGDGGANDNVSLHWDKNINGCFLFGDPIMVTFACPIETVPTVNCNTLTNGIDITITEGQGDYTVVNQGEGDLLSTNVLNGGTAQIENLTNNESWEIDITDAAGCIASIQGIFGAPTIANIVYNPAPDCPDLANGDIEVTLGSSGTAPYTVDMNANLNVAGVPYVYSGQSGTAVTITVTDNLGCVYQEVQTITSAGHSIDTSNVVITDEDCFGDGTGAISFDVLPTDVNGVQDGNITNIDWTDSFGNVFPGGAGNNSLTNMIQGPWSVTITDDFGCEFEFGFTIGGPQELDIYVVQNEGLTCFEDGSGDVTVAFSGGVFAGNPVYTWQTEDGLNPGVTTVTNATANQLNAGLLEVFVTDDNGCKDSLEIIVEEPDQLEASITVKNVLCYGGSDGIITIDNVANAVGNISYGWALVTQPNPPSTSNIASGLPIGTYAFSVSDGVCSRQYVRTISQNDSIYWIQLITDSTICRNQVPFDGGNGGIVYSAGRGGSGIGGSSFIYSLTEDATGITTNSTTVSGLDPGYYTVTATDLVGCELSTTVYLDSISPKSDFTITFEQGEPLCVGPAVEIVDFSNESINYAFSEDPNADTTFVWQFSLVGDTLLIDTVITDNINQNVQYPYGSEGLYQVCLTVIENLNGCEDSICKTIQIYDCPGLEAPNVFTPGAVGSSGDGVNDNFFFPNVAIIEFECTVYDRWGKKVFEYTDINQSWDGNNMNNGKPCSDGVYFYVYSGDSSNGTHYEGQGNIHLIRE